MKPAAKSGKMSHPSMDEDPAAFDSTSVRSSRKKVAIPHVVRVVFLGVAGITATPPTAAVDVKSPSSSKQSPKSKSPPSTRPISPGLSVSTSSSSGSGEQPPKRPLLFFPEPTKLRLVASVSRSRTARGIPSSPSGCLMKSPHAPIREVDNPSASPHSNVHTTRQPYSKDPP